MKLGSCLPESHSLEEGRLNIVSSLSPVHLVLLVSSLI